MKTRKRTAPRHRNHHAPTYRFIKWNPRNPHVNTNTPLNNHDPFLEVIDLMVEISNLIGPADVHGLAICHSDSEKRIECTHRDGSEYRVTVGLPDSRDKRRNIYSVTFPQQRPGCTPELIAHQLEIAMLQINEASRNRMYRTASFRKLEFPHLDPT